MDNYLKAYLIGCAVSLVLCLIITISKDKVRLSDLISVLLNVACSWATTISLVGMLINNLLTSTNKNPVIFGSKSDSNKKQFIRYKH